MLEEEVHHEMDPDKIASLAQERFFNNFNINAIQNMLKETKVKKTKRKKRKIRIYSK